MEGARVMFCDFTQIQFYSIIGKYDVLGFVFDNDLDKIRTISDIASI